MVQHLFLMIIITLKLLTDETEFSINKTFIF
jgi:hypothetical protein